MCYYFFSFWYSIQLQKESIFWNYTFLKFESKKIFHKLIKKPTEGQQKKKKEQFWNSAYLHVSTDQSFHVSKSQNGETVAADHLTLRPISLVGQSRENLRVFSTFKISQLHRFASVEWCYNGWFLFGYILFFFSLSLSKINL